MIFMEQDFIYVKVPFDSLIESIKILDLDELIRLQQYINNQIIAEEDSEELFSEVGIDYKPLRALLKSEDWQAATHLTLNLIQQAAGQDHGIMIESDEDFGDSVNFPVSDINTIDRLWIRYSRGKFGFSIQKQIWEDNARETKQFGELIGWKVQGRYVRVDELNFTLDSPLGHLPFLPHGFRHASDALEPECFTDSHELGSSYRYTESVEPIELWELLVENIYMEQ